MFFIFASCPCHVAIPRVSNIIPFELASVGLSELIHQTCFLPAFHFALPLNFELFNWVACGACCMWRVECGTCGCTSLSIVNLSAYCEYYLIQCDALSSWESLSWCWQVFHWVYYPVQHSLISSMLTNHTAGHFTCLWILLTPLYLSPRPPATTLLTANVLHECKKFFN